MRKFFRSIILLLVLFISWPFIEKQIEKTDFHPVLETIQSEISNIIEHPNVTAALNTIYQTVNDLVDDLDGVKESSPQNKEQMEVEKPNLAIPSEHAFSVHNIVLGVKKQQIEQQFGIAKRISSNEYGTDWHAYHDHYQNFFMVAYNENDAVAGLYTNQDLISSTYEIERGTPKEQVLQKLGDPINQIRKGMIFFQFQNDRDYDVFFIDDSYITIFYDKHEENTVTSIQIIDEELEDNKKSFYSDASSNLKEGFELQLFDLTNAGRVNHDLSVLSWDDHVRETARKHSMDMAVNNYFSHTNLDGQSPFDRMSEDNIFFTVAGENLATGQFSSIFAHEGLMNSLGHRENILHPTYQYLGVGVAFNDDSHPYYTEKFFKR